MSAPTRTERRRSWIDRVLSLSLSALVGSLVAAGAYVTTQSHSTATFFPADWGGEQPMCTTTLTSPGFDPWTGFPHGWKYTCDPVQGGIRAAQTSRGEGPIPAVLANRWAVPLPLGFLVGFVPAFVGLARRDPWRSASGSRTTSDIGQR